MIQMKVNINFIIGKIWAFLFKAMLKNNVENNH